jgi:hypothetical protein
MERVEMAAASNAANEAAPTGALAGLLPLDVAQYGPA